MNRVFTPTTIAEIVKRAHDGANSRMIASELGLNPASLRVKCSQLGISLRKCRALGQDTAGNGARIELCVPHARAKRSRKVMQMSKAKPDITTADPLIVVVSGITLKRLRYWGVAKGMTAEMLAARLLTVIAHDGLCKAILDDDAA